MKLSRQRLAVIKTEKEVTMKVRLVLLVVLLSSSTANAELLEYICGKGSKQSLLRFDTEKLTEARCGECGFLTDESYPHYLPEFYLREVNDAIFMKTPGGKWESKYYLWYQRGEYVKFSHADPKFHIKSAIGYMWVFYIEDEYLFKGPNLIGNRWEMLRQDCRQKPNF